MHTSYLSVFSGPRWLDKSQVGTTDSWEGRRSKDLWQRHQLASARPLSLADLIKTEDRIGMLVNNHIFVTQNLFVWVNFVWHRFKTCILRVLLCTVCFCTGHFVMVPINLTCPHCLQHFFFVHLFHLYY